MNNIRIWYSKHRRTIWIPIIIIITSIAFMESLNNNYRKLAKDESSSTNSATTYNTTNYSVVSQKEIDNKVSQKSVNIIEDFFSFCNEGEVESAYNLLSTECKEELYPTIQDFITNYYNRIFTEKRSYDSMLWISNSSRNTYRVQIMRDLLSTGQKDSMPIEDFYTIINENDGYKLNISSYIGKKDINISKTQNNVTVNIVSKKMYMDYEIYEIKVENNSKNDLIFNTKENTKSMYIKDENDLKYIAFLHEIADSEFEVMTGIPKTVEIKFNRGYKPTIRIQKIIFEDIKINGQIVNMEIDI